MDCHLSVDKSELSEIPTVHVAIVDDEELELSELQAGPNPLQCSAHLSSSGRHDCPLCKGLNCRAILFLSVVMSCNKLYF
jgi:hypothetical protein